MATDRPRYTVSVDQEMFEQIEDFRFEKRFGTRSEATVELIRLGLEALKNNGNTEQNDHGKKNVDTILHNEHERCTAQPASPVREIPVAAYSEGASTGLITEDEYEEMKKARERIKKDKKNGK